MAKKVTAQEQLSTGSFLVSVSNEGDLVQGKMYRVKSTKQDGKYIVLDHEFCGTDELKGKTLAFKGRFKLMSEDEVKVEFKTLLERKGFTKAGQEFLDVRSGGKVVVEDNSRTHILAKFGKFMGVKIAGGHVWFAGKEWAKTLVDPETMPEEDSPKEESKGQPVADEFWVHCQSKSEAIHLCNTYGRSDAHTWTEYWEVYTADTVYCIDDKHGVVTAYTSTDYLEEKGEVTLMTYHEWCEYQGTPDKEDEPKKRKTLMKVGSLEEQILAVVDEHLDSDEARKHMSDSVERLLNKWGIDKNVRQLEVKIADKPVVKVGKVHFKYDLVLKCMMARTNVALVGPAGSGKTTTVAKAAEALELKFYSKSVSAQTGSHEFFGYQDAQGRYVRTLFREAYENGGVFLLDEFDAGNPNVLAALNQATANEHCAFADGMIAKHEDFICVMAGNTFGHGANSEYVGRNKIDAATLDRFAFIQFPYDEDLEHALATNKAWCKKVQAFRKKAEQKKIRTVISPRATIMGGQLMSNGVSEKEVMELLIFKGLNEEERNLLK